VKAKLTPAEGRLLVWFKQRPMQKVSAEELRDHAETIWGRSLLDGPRVARSLWERGLLERNNGTKAPYWYVPSADHKEIAIERQRTLLSQALNATRSRIEALARYANQPNVMTRTKAEAVKRFCTVALKGLEEVEAD
jgi:hypothetical protein